MKSEYRNLEFELTRQKVQRAMRNAISNGYTQIATLDPAAVVADLVTYDSDFEDYTLPEERQELADHVAYLQKNDRLIQIAGQERKEG